jgi:hypothetical protein
MRFGVGAILARVWGLAYVFITTLIPASFHVRRSRPEHTTNGVLSQAARTGDCCAFVPASRIKLLAASELSVARDAPSFEILWF